MQGSRVRVEDNGDSAGPRAHGTVAKPCTSKVRKTPQLSIAARRLDQDDWRVERLNDLSQALRPKLCSLQTQRQCQDNRTARTRHSFLRTLLSFRYTSGSGRLARPNAPAHLGGGGFIFAMARGLAFSTNV